MQTPRADGTAGDGFRNYLKTPIHRFGRGNVIRPTRQLMKLHCGRK